MLNLEYYLISLSDIDAQMILSTNTVIDNIMYCDKFRKKQELADAVRTAYERIQLLGKQEKEEFNGWVKSILLSVCGNREAVVEEILNWAGNGVDDMAFKYNIIKAFEDERAEGIAEGRTVGIAEGQAASIIVLLEEKGTVPDQLRKTIMQQNDSAILREWLQRAAHTDTVEEFEHLIR